MVKPFIIGIDATNLRSGGGVTHIVELLTAAEPEYHGISKVVVWGGEKTLAKLPERPWLEKVNPIALNRGLLWRIYWQRFFLSRAAHEAECSVLFVPGGSFVGNFKPVVVMSQNLLPFEWQEICRYGWSLAALKLVMLRIFQSHSFRAADGVIFLTNYSRQAVLKVTGQIAGKVTTIPHGLNCRFQFKPMDKHPVDEYTELNPCRLLYVSIINEYKHQWHVVAAVHALRMEGLSVVLKLVGPAYPPAMARLQAVIERLDPEGRWVYYHGAAPYEILHQIYEQADIGIFASSCENLPITLLETMASGLPVACSNRGPMPEVLRDTGLYFDPENPAEIAQAIRKYYLSHELRSEKSNDSFERAQNFSWVSCADQTFSFLFAVAHGQKN